MKRLLIGQFGQFDKIKHKRDFRNDFYGIEACSMNTEQDIDELITCVNKEDCAFGIHFPFRSGQWDYRDPQYLSVDPQAKEASYAYMNKEMEYMRDFKPTYVLLHIPKPALIIDDLDLSQWRFGHKSEYMTEQDINIDVFYKELEEFFKWFEEKGTENSFIPLLEFDFLHPWLYENNKLEDLLKQYPSVKLCIDFPRLHLQSELMESFEPLHIIRKYGSRAWLIHLSQGRLLDNHTNNHFPALPDLEVRDGWADLSSYFEELNRVNNTYKVLFEHRSDRITDNELEACYVWTRDLIGDK